MAAKVGPSTVSYGIGVQNRYSAFLEDEDSFALSNIIKRPTNEHHVVSKQKSTVSAPKSTGTKAGQRSDLSTNNQNKKQDGQQKSSPSQAGGQQIKGDMRRQQRDGKPSQSHQANGSGGHPARNHANRTRNSNQDGTATANGSQRYTRNQHNGTHQQSDNATQQQSKENQGNYAGRPMRSNNMRPHPRPRTQNDDKRASQQQHDGQQVNGHLASNEEEKARRQQKRLNNLRFKDPEKRERRNQATNDGVDQQAKVNEQSDERPADQRGPRNRRDSDKNRVRPRRNNPNGESNGDTVRRENRRERPNRQRGEFGGSETGNNKPEKPKPIPNFSDKSDFPSLAS